MCQVGSGNPEDTNNKVVIFSKRNYKLISIEPAGRASIARSPVSLSITTSLSIRREAKKGESLKDTTMANHPAGFPHLMIISCLLLALTVEGGGDEWSWMPARGGCRGTIAECMAAGELEMESEMSRRILATTKYISYGALQRNTVPCSRRGASYYNCKRGAEANPYSRGCSTITRCRS